MVSDDDIAQTPVQELLASLPEDTVVINDDAVAREIHAPELCCRAVACSDSLVRMLTDQFWLEAHAREQAVHPEDVVADRVADRYRLVADRYLV